MNHDPINTLSKTIPTSPPSKILYLPPSNDQGLVLENSEWSNNPKENSMNANILIPK